MVYELVNERTGSRIITSCQKKLGLVAFGSLKEEWYKECKAFKEYMEKYPSLKEYDKHIEELEKAEKKEFCANLFENIRKYSVWEIRECEQTQTM